MTRARTGRRRLFLLLYAVTAAWPTAVNPLQKSHRQPEFGLEPITEWAMQVGGPQADASLRVAVDGDGGTCVAGAFETQAELRLSDGVTRPAADGKPLGSADKPGLFVLRFGPTGRMLWRYQATGELAPAALAIGPSGRIYVAGGFGRRADFGATSLNGGVTATATAGTDPFVLCLDKDGLPLWARGYGSDAENDKAETGLDLALDGDENLYLTGVCGGRFGTAARRRPGEQPLATDGVDAFVASLTSEGAERWSTVFGGRGPDHGQAVRVASDGTVLVAGTFSDQVAFDGTGDRLAPVRSAGGRDAFLASLSPAGRVTRVLNWGGRFDESVRPGCLRVDRDGRLYVAGEFVSGCDFDPGPETATHYSQGQSDGYLLVLSERGRYERCQIFGGPGADYVSALDLDPDRGLVLGGSFTGRVDFDPGPNQHYLLAPGGRGAGDAFLVRLTLDGEYLWALRLGDPTGDYRLNTATGVAFAPHGRVLATGSFSGLLELDPEREGAVLSGAGGRDGWTVRLREQVVEAPEAGPGLPERVSRQGSNQVVKAQADGRKD